MKGRKRGGSGADTAQGPTPEPRQHSGDESEPLGDLGHTGKTRTPDPGGQAISNRAGAEEDDGLNAETGDDTRD